VREPKSFASIAVLLRAATLLLVTYISAQAQRSKLVATAIKDFIIGGNNALAGSPHGAPDNSLPIFDATLVPLPEKTMTAR
jgi:hypothetical protein